MFCTNCGSAVSERHRYCGHCGAPVDGPVEPLHELEDWRQTTDIRVVLNHPEVKSLVEAAAGVNGGQLSAEEFLESAKPLLTMAGLGAVPFKAILDVTPGMFARLGVETGKELDARFPFQPGRTMAGALCSLASRGQPIVEGSGADAASSVKARLQSSVLTHKGEITIVFAPQAEGTQVHAQVAIPGQAFDWGRSKRVLDDLYSDIRRFVGLQP